MKTTAKDFFLWVAAQVALLVSSVSIVVLWFEYIDQLLGTSTYTPGYGYSSSIVTAMATLVVVFPLFVWFTRLLHTDIRTTPAKKELWVRTWLVMGTVFVAGLVLAVDCIVLLQNFLSGEELTAAFCLKVLSLLSLMLGIVLYYIYDLRGVWERRKKESQFIGAFVSLMVVCTVLSAFFIIGTPHSQRLLRYDQQRVQDLQALQSQLLNHYQQQQVLPETLAVLNDPLAYFVVPVDPEANGEGYTYTKKDATHFSLCATFNVASPKVPKPSPTLPRPVAYYALDPTLEYWEHGVGRACFEREIDPKKYPKMKM
jgi:hypothetical protein